MAPKIRTDSGLEDSSRVILDVTRLIDRLRHRRLPTGIDRVGLAYIEHFGPRSRALVRWGGRAHLLPASESRLLFRWLLKPGSRSALYLLLGVGIFRSLLSPPAAAFSRKDVWPVYVFTAFYLSSLHTYTNIHTHTPIVCHLASFSATSHLPASYGQPSYPTLTLF